MMEQMYAQALNLCDTLAQKQRICGLSDFEYRLYEKLCNTFAVYFGGLEFAFKISAMETEMKCSEEEVAYLEWLTQQEDERIRAEKEEKKREDEDPPEEPSEV